MFRSTMGGNSDADEFDDDDTEVDDDVGDGDDGLDLDRVIKDLDIAKRRAAKTGEPAWRLLEQRMEQKHTAELISDFEDYDIGEPRANANANAARNGKIRH